MEVELEYVEVDVESVDDEGDVESVEVELSSEDEEVDGEVPAFDELDDATPQNVSTR